MKKAVANPKMKIAASTVPSAGSSSSSISAVAITPSPPTVSWIVVSSRDPSWNVITKMTGSTTPQVTIGPTVSCAISVTAATATGAATGCRRIASSGRTASTTITYAQAPPRVGCSATRTERRPR